MTQRVSFSLQFSFNQIQTGIRPERYAFERIAVRKRLFVSYFGVAMILGVNFMRTFRENKIIFTPNAVEN